MNSEKKALIDPREVVRALGLLVAPEQVVEVRLLNATTYASPRYPYQASGYFNDMDHLVDALDDVKSARGIYITLQPCTPALLARAQNRLRSADEMKGEKSSTADTHILGYRWLLIDCDPDRPAGISSNNEEHSLALAHAKIILGALSDLGWPDPIEADSGNGAHLLYAIDLPTSEGSLVKRVLEGLADRFDREGLHVDQTVFNPSRISKLYGTLACKGDDTDERPHRMSRILHAPQQINVVSREQLEAIARSGPSPSGTSILTQMQQALVRPKSFDLDAWIERYQLDVTGPTAWDKGRRWVFNVCPWNPDHTDKSAYLVQFDTGAIAAGCQHNGCKDKTWRDLRILYEPERLQQTITSIPEMEIPDVDLSLVLKCLRESEWGDGLLFAHVFKDRCVYDHTAKKWHLWQGHSWKRDDIGTIRQLLSGKLASIYQHTADEMRAQLPLLTPNEGAEVDLKDQAQDQKKEELKNLERTVGQLTARAKELRTLSRNTNTLTFASTTSHMGVTSDLWDNTPWFLGTPDGVLDLRTGEMHSGDPHDYIRTIIPTHWEGLDTPAPRFERFLREIFADRSDIERDELIAFLQRMLGYGITGHVHEHVFLMLFGEEGRNGKDTLMTALLNVLGQVVGPVSNDVIISTGKVLNPGAAKPHLCALQGKRIAWASETEKGARFDLGQLKFLSGGGGIPTRQLHGEEYTFQPSHLLVLLTNNKPHADATERAFWDRLCLISFALRFVANPVEPNERKKDTTLGAALQKEKSGILAWLVRGCLSWQEQGLLVPQSVLRARAAYQEEEDTLGHFVKECCQTGSGYSVTGKALYSAYKAWAQENNIKPMNGNSFGLAMKKSYVCNHTKQGNHYEGITLMATAHQSQIVTSALHDLKMDTPF